jgi:hypothetical protein
MNRNIESRLARLEATEATPPAIVIGTDQAECDRKRKALGLGDNVVAVITGVPRSEDWQ